MKYESEIVFNSEVSPGVRVRIARMSYGRRLSLLEQVRELIQQREFHEAGKSLSDQVQSARQSILIDKCYWRWGLLSVEGIQLDGKDATPESLWETGPEPLVAEVLQRLKRETGLSEEERKN